MTLSKQVKNWSSSSDISFGQNQIIRITVTFISPEIAQMAIYNQLLYNPIFGSDFKTPMDKGMDSIAQRDEFEFLVTITASVNVATILGEDAVILDVPIKEMVLTNTADLIVQPKHDDHLLDEEIHLKNGKFIAGFIGYPIAVGNELQCTEVMEPIWNTSVTIRIPSYSIDGNLVQDSLTWNISYRTLIDFGAPPAAPIPNNVPNGIAIDFSPSVNPPIPVNNISDAELPYWDYYWQTMARFVWWQVIYQGNP